MECQKIINLLDYTTNQPSKFRTTHYVEMNCEEHIMSILTLNLKLQW